MNAGRAALPVSLDKACQGLGQTRRSWLKRLAAGAAGVTASRWLPQLAMAASAHPGETKRCIVLWMSGGPSQMDTFDLKPGHANGGPFQETETPVPGVRISEHLPQLAAQIEHLALVRSMHTREGDHQRATTLLRTGYRPLDRIDYPALGAIVAQQLGNAEAALPNFVSIAPYGLADRQGFGSGFLGPAYSPLVIRPERRVSADERELSFAFPNVKLPDGVGALRSLRRRRLLEQARSSFRERQLNGQASGELDSASLDAAHELAYRRAWQLIEIAGRGDLDLEREPSQIRERYGKNVFGQGCMLARRLVERGVPFVEVSLGNGSGMTTGWDTHQNNFESVRYLSGILDAAFAALITDLRDRGLLDSTLIVWMGEFGRTPKINDRQGRDHFPAAWSTVLAGGGLPGGAVIGRTSPDGVAVEERPVSVPDLLATICLALGIDHRKQNISPQSRPIRLVDVAARPIQELVG